MSAAAPAPPPPVTPPGGSTQPLWAPPRRSAWAIPAAVALALLAFALRAVMPLADPPAWIADGPAPASAGAHALAAAGARLGEPSAGPDAGRDHRLGRPLLTGAALACFRVTGGFAVERAALPAALAGALLVLVAFFALQALAGDRVALVAAALLACDALLVGWARAGHPVVPAALAATLSVIVAVAGRGRPLPVLGAILAAAAATYGVGLWAGFAALPVLVMGLQALARYRGERGRVALWAVLGAFVVLTAAVLAASPALVGRGIEHARGLAQDLRPLEVAARALSAPARSRVALAAPVVLALALAAPFLAPRGAAAGKVRTSLTRALVALVVLGFVATGILAPDDPAGVIAFYPAAVVLAVLALEGLERGGARRPRLPGVAWFAVALVTGAALLEGAADALGRWAGPLPWVVDEAVRWLAGGAATLPNRLLAAAAPAALVAGLASRRPAERRRRPARGLARALLGLHILSQVALVLLSLLGARSTLAAARADLRAMLPEGAVLSGDHAHALALGGPNAARLPASEPPDPVEESARGVTHLAVERGVLDQVVRPRARRAGLRVEEVASVYVVGRRLEVVRLGAAGAPLRSALEEGRLRLDDGDLAGARGALARAAAAHPEAHLPRVLLAITETLAGDLDAARGHAEAALALAPSSVTAALAAALVAARRGEADAAERRLAAAARGADEPAIRDLLRDLAAARARGDERARAEALGPRLTLLVADLLR